MFVCLKKQKRRVSRHNQRKITFNVSDFFVTWKFYLRDFQIFDSILKEKKCKMLSLLNSSIQRMLKHVFFKSSFHFNKNVYWNWTDDNTHLSSHLIHIYFMCETWLLHAWTRVNCHVVVEKKEQCKFQEYELYKFIIFIFYFLFCDFISISGTFEIVIKIYTLNM